MQLWATAQSLFIRLKPEAKQTTYGKQANLLKLAEAAELFCKLT